MNQDEHARYLRKHKAWNWQWPGTGDGDLPRNCWPTKAETRNTPQPYFGPSARVRARRERKGRRAHKYQ